MVGSWFLTANHTENRFTHLGGTFYDIKTVYVLRLITHHNLRVSGRGTRVDFSCGTAFCCHQDKERYLRMEVRRNLSSDLCLSESYLRAFYLDGALVDPKTKGGSEPRPCAGNDGTTITVKHRC